MKKITQVDILKPGAQLKAEKLDVNDPVVAKKIEETKREQVKVLALKNIDYEALRDTYITI